MPNLAGERGLGNSERATTDSTYLRVTRNHFDGLGGGGGGGLLGRRGVPKSFRSVDLGLC